MLNELTARPRKRGQRLLVIAAIGIGTGVVIVFSMVYAVSVLQWGEEDARRNVQQGRLAEESERARVQLQASTQEEAARPRTTVLVAKTGVSAGAPLDPNNFESRDVQADSVAATAVKSVDELRGKLLSQPAQAGNPIPAYNVYDPADLAATAEIVDAEISPSNVMPGGLLSIRVTVKNTSGSRIRTMGPVPGFTYELGENYRQNSCTTQGNGAQQCGLGPVQYASWGVAVGSTGSNQTNLPYRWGFGGDLAPGDTTTVTGQIRINRYFEATHFWVALVREPDAVNQNVAGMTVVTSLPVNTVNPPAR
jgi:hypothetical protein